MHRIIFFMGGLPECHFRGTMFAIPVKVPNPASLLRMPVLYVFFSWIRAKNP